MFYLTLPPKTPSQLRLIVRTYAVETSGQKINHKLIIILKTVTLRKKKYNTAVHTKQNTNIT